jgi:hypothetical protein
MHLGRPHQPATTAAAFMVVALLPTLGGAQSEAVFDHLRPIDRMARDLLDEAWQRSETVRDLTAIIERSDLFVQIEIRGLEAFRGHLRFMSGSPECRWVRITLSAPARRLDLMATLAHELQHGVELAQAPDARDLESVEALFCRIGFQRDEPHFETVEALAVERRVRRELAQNVRTFPRRSS